MSNNSRTLCTIFKWDLCLPIFSKSSGVPLWKLLLWQQVPAKVTPNWETFMMCPTFYPPKKLKLKKALKFLFYIGTISKNQCVPHKVNGNYSSNWNHLRLFWKSFQNHELTLHKPTIHTSFLTTQVWFLLIFAFPTIIMIFGRHETFFVSVVQAEPFSWECQSECVSLIKAQHLHHVHYQF